MFPPRPRLRTMTPNTCPFVSTTRWPATSPVVATIMFILRSEQLTSQQDTAWSWRSYENRVEHPRVVWPWAGADLLACLLRPFFGLAPRARTPATRVSPTGNLLRVRIGGADCVVSTRAPTAVRRSLGFSSEI